MSIELAEKVIQRGTERKLSVVTAESCTGGLISAALTDIAGSSAVLDRGFVTYSNEAKAEMLQVPVDLIESAGAVSATVARTMVAGALANFAIPSAGGEWAVIGPSLTSAAVNLAADLPPDSNPMNR